MGCTFCAIPQFRGRHPAGPSGTWLPRWRARRARDSGARRAAADAGHARRDLSGKPGHRRSAPRALRYEDAGRPGPCTPSARCSATAWSPAGPARGWCPTSTCPCSTATTACCARCRRRRTAVMKEIVAQFREAIPGVTVRTTVLVGFPGETEAAFATVAGLHRGRGLRPAGASTYSTEEGTPAAG